jgi:hypothetical protein
MDFISCSHFRALMTFTAVDHLFVSGIKIMIAFTDFLSWSLSDVNLSLNVNEIHSAIKVLSH